jgi:hypothetical protein
MSQPATRRRTAPLHPRRVSGPTRATPRLAAPAIAIPARPRHHTGAFERIRALPDNYVVDRLLRSRACIWVIGVMLAGIVSVQVSLLKLNTGISRAVETTSTLQRQNASLESAIAKAQSGDRIRAAATKDNMIDPPAGSVRYLGAPTRSDVARAIADMRPPSPAAVAIMDNYGKQPGVLAAAATQATTVAGAGTLSASTTVTATATPVYAATPVPTPVPTTAPVATATPIG